MTAPMVDPTMPKTSSMSGVLMATTQVVTVTKTVMPKNRLGGIQAGAAPSEPPPVADDRPWYCWNKNNASLVRQSTENIDGLVIIFRQSLGEDNYYHPYFVILRKNASMVHNSFLHSCYCVSASSIQKNCGTRYNQATQKNDKNLLRKCDMVVFLKGNTYMKS